MTFCLGPRPKSWQRRSGAPSPSPLTSSFSQLHVGDSIVPSSPRLGPSNAPSIPGRSRFVVSVSVSAKSLPSPSLSPSLSPSPVLAESTIYVPLHVHAGSVLLQDPSSGPHGVVAARLPSGVARTGTGQEAIARAMAEVMKEFAPGFSFIRPSTCMLYPKDVCRSASPSAFSVSSPYRYAEYGRLVYRWDYRLVSTSMRTSLQR